MRLQRQAEGKNEPHASRTRGLTGRAAAAFMFFNFFLSVCATAFAVRAVEEIQVKQREEYNRLSVLSDTLQFEPDTRQ